jgi:SAM-dependent methyltransferase
LDSLETGIALYNSRPNIIGDAGRLPFHDQTFDTVVMLEILEHLPDPTIAIQEARRTLKKDGILILSAPFLYPIHDAPKDYQRWTRHGLEHLAGASRLIIRDLINMGNPIETGILLYNLSLAWLALHGPTASRLPLLLMSVVTIPFLNIIGFMISLLFKKIGSNPFAIGYLLITQEESE